MKFFMISRVNEVSDFKRLVDMNALVAIDIGGENSELVKAYDYLAKLNAEERYGDINFHIVSGDVLQSYLESSDVMSDIVLITGESTRVNLVNEDSSRYVYIRNYIDKIDR